MRDKYKEEIEEILRKAGEVAPGPSETESRSATPEDRPRNTRAPNRAPAQRVRTSSRRWTISSGKLMLAGLVFILIGLVIRPLIWIGLAALVAAYLLYFLKHRSHQPRKKMAGTLGGKTRRHRPGTG